MCDKNCCYHTYHALIFLLILSLLVLPDIPNLNHYATTSGGDVGGDFPSPPCTTTTTITRMILPFLCGALLALVLMIISNNWSLISSKQVDQLQPSTSACPSYTPAYMGPTEDGGAEEGGVGYVVLRTFPTFAYSKSPTPKMGKGAKACVICQYKFRDQEMVRWLPDCDHLFHISCIDEWLKSHRTCPCCRAQLDFPTNNFGFVTNNNPTISPNDYYDDYFSNEYYYNNVF